MKKVLCNLIREDCKENIFHLNFKIFIFILISYFISLFTFFMDIEICALIWKKKVGYLIISYLIIYQLIQPIFFFRHLIETNYIIYNIFLLIILKFILFEYSNKNYFTHLKDLNYWKETFKVKLFLKLKKLTCLVTVLTVL